jgi:hypothetical protein|tara:strand:+ start:23 stop:286 length:264 start_codon:yes stop_codon:yes gene_type:complete
MRNFGLQESKKITFRYRGTGKFAVRKAEKQAEAKERQDVFNELTNTPQKINDYINSNGRYWCPVGDKVKAKLIARAMKMVNHKKKSE